MWDLPRCLRDAGARVEPAVVALPVGCECDCALYCPQCVREVLRDAAESGKRSNEPQGGEPESGESFFVGECDPGPQNYYVGEYGHRLVINYRGLIGPYPCDTPMGAKLPDPVPAAPGGWLEPTP